MSSYEYSKILHIKSKSNSVDLCLASVSKFKIFRDVYWLDVSRWFAADDKMYIFQTGEGWALFL